MRRYISVYVNIDDGDTRVDAGDFLNQSEAFDALFEDNHSVDWFILPEEKARLLRDNLTAVLDST